jgi:Skp family chaperone for outer membrane proteins
MARETKAQRLEREAAEREARLAAERESYPTRLMEALQRVGKQWNMELKVRDGQFVVSDRNNVYELNYTWDVDSWDSLAELEWDLNSLEEEEREANRRAEVKREAQRKVNEMLTTEERELLGL